MKINELTILAGPDRLAFANSQYVAIDSHPVPGFMMAPVRRGGDKPTPPSYLGEIFLVKTTDGPEFKLPLIPETVTRKGWGGRYVEFTAVLWADCEEFRELLPIHSIDPWIIFKGEYDFATQTGTAKRIDS